MRRIDAAIEDPPQKRYELINSRDILIVINRDGMYHVCRFLGTAIATSSLIMQDVPFPGEQYTRRKVQREMKGVHFF